MPKVRITGWRSGLHKINMTKTIRAHLGCGLAEAKLCTDQTLAGKEVVLEVSDAEVARALVRELEALGAESFVEPDEPSPQNG